MRNSRYFPHDQDARNDEKIIRLIRSEGLEGYGAYWSIVELLYCSGGRIDNDPEAIAFSIRSEPDKVKRVISGFDLFIVDGQKFGSPSVDRRIAEMKSRSESARQAANIRHHGRSRRKNKNHATA